MGKAPSASPAPADARPHILGMTTEEKPRCEGRLPTNAGKKEVGGEDPVPSNNLLRSRSIANSKPSEKKKIARFGLASQPGSARTVSRSQPKRNHDRRVLRPPSKDLHPSDRPIFRSSLVFSSRRPQTERNEEDSTRFENEGPFPGSARFNITFDELILTMEPLFPTDGEAMFTMEQLHRLGIGFHDRPRILYRHSGDRTASSGDRKMLDFRLEFTTTTPQPKRPFHLTHPTGPKAPPRSPRNTTLSLTEHQRT
ncbi:unnamed protein product [Darwinula stevensoni]|uniref:Uncharacterized protein n=1 Tax=Darwinula stevensoni TaxID=69355 RepID=A0A7R9A5J5_9CRUS|nr:unnamed protein product [Darwinula stevensoni]CAG0886660.1 unnamed protein product [Darwinula stevensoni]